MNEKGKRIDQTQQIYKDLNESMQRRRERE